MSTIPQRKPDTPLMTFYTTGKYEKEITRSLNRRPNAIPGQAATMNERNKRPDEEINVKSITQSNFPNKYYDPTKYLRPYENSGKEGHKDVGMNSLTYNRIINQKKSIQEGNLAPTDNALPQGKLLKQDDFNKKRSADELRMKSNGKFICEKVLQVSKDEQEYFNNSKIYTKEDKTSPYKKQIPTYFRMLEDPKNQKKLNEINNNDGLLQIVSKNQGWITVNTQTLDRKHPYEKGGIGGDASKTSILTPQWMQTAFPKNKSDTMTQSVERFGLRAENNRTFLVDRDQPQKSIFNYQDVRHNVHSKALANEYSMKAQISDKPVRLMDWKEQTKNQSYDKPIAPKIGSYHERQNN